MKGMLSKLGVRQDNRKNQVGFTFIEMLIVLSIVIIISTITFLQLKPLVDQKNIDYFFEQFTDDMLLAQMYAMSHEQSVQIIFIEAKPSYKIVSNGIIITERTLHSGFKINTATLGSQIFYRNNGSISKSGTLYFSYRERVFKVVFLLGEGRFYVSEL